MLNNPSRKVVRDLWINKRRTFLVVLSIAVGVFAVGVVAHMRVIIEHDLADSYASVNPASTTIYTTTPFEEELVIAIRRMPEVREAEGLRSVIATFKVEEGNSSRALELFAIHDYENMSINKVRPEIEFKPDPVSWPNPNVWPPPERSLLIERTSVLVAYLGLTRSKQGDTILIQTPRGKERELPLAGLTYDFSRLPAPSAGRAYGYITFDTLEWLGEPRNFNQLHVIVAGNRNDKEYIKRVVQKVKRKIEKSGLTVVRTDIPEPGKLPLDSQFQAMSVVLGALGILSLLLSGFLVVNTISAILTQNIRQIGVMKAIGARNRQIMTMYLSMVVIFALLALLVAVPLAAQTARSFINFMSYFINFNLSDFSIPSQVLVIEVMAGLFVPLLAALYPILAGTRITVHEAMTFTGLDDNEFGTNIIDRLLERVRGLPRPLLLSLRNTFRRKARLLLTLMTLILACAIFIAVFSVRASLLLTLENAQNLWQFDVQLFFDRPHRLAKIDKEALSIPGVVQVEGWHQGSGFRLRSDDSEGSNILITALPAASEMIQPKILSGRWLLQEDTKALVVNSTFLQEEPDIKIGDKIELKIEGDKAQWQLVGVVETVATPQSMAFVNYPHFVKVIRDVGKGSSLQIITERHDAQFQEQVVEEMRAHFEHVGMAVNLTQTSASLREGALAYSNIIIFFLMVMAILLASVGGLGLMGTMSLNVLERTREIGVMRAIGASDSAVHQIVVVEGLFIGLLSWFIGAIVAFPLGRFLSYEVGIRFVQQPLNYSFSREGLLISIVFMLALSAFAAWLPAQNASHLSVYEALSYK